MAAALVLGIGLPLIAAAAIAIATVRRQSASRWGSALAVALGYGIAHVAVTGAPPPVPIEARDWLVHLTVIAALFGAIEDRLPAAARWGGRMAIATATAWLVLGSRIEFAWSGAAAVLWPAAAALALLALWSGLSAIASHGRGRNPIAVFGALAGGSALALVFSGTASGGQLVGGLAAAAGGIFAASLVRPAASSAVSAAAPVFTVVLGGHWLIGLSYAEMPSAAFVALIAAAPVAGLAASAAIARAKSPFARALAPIAAVVGSVGTAVFLAASAYFAAPALSETTPSAADAADQYGDRYGDTPTAPSRGDDSAADRNDHSDTGSGDDNYDYAYELAK